MDVSIQQISKKFNIDNIHRAKYFAWIAIMLESLLIVLNIVQNKAIWNYYLLFYILLLVFSALFLVLLYVLDKRFYHYKLMKIAIWSYYWFTLMWGASITLLDQSSYGQVTAYLINLLGIAVMYHVRLKYFVLLQSIPTFYLLGGLLIVQSDSAIVFAHFINITLFIIISVVGSYFIYRGYYKMFEQEQLLLQKNNQLTFVNSDLQLLATHDELTAIPNRRGLYDYVEATMGEEPRHITAVLLDIDAFKYFNDYYGHLEGDKVLQEVAAILKELAGEHYFVARFGGEEFIYLMFDVERKTTMHFANKICNVVEQRRIQHKASPFFPYVTVSIGIATNPFCKKDDLHQLFQDADTALYNAKKAGRNRAELSI
ncbi:GGDEF domain-containing protein [Metasolibacillus meyeri]|uniref:GGDEF domain-containing protein n=1 Tax=Metasolibacillus meyeri TaxID=1071052 RepID=A0AAW9NV35_9BACL|nr:GGDEF domain-containing protein [Metasolibacillus meyeri]MEC1179735.1 GGDEF domain-containing protein [Metasolibacillus meyeri]